MPQVKHAACRHTPAAHIKPQSQLDLDKGRNPKVASPLAEVFIGHAVDILTMRVVVLTWPRVEVNQLHQTRSAGKQADTKVQGVHAAPTDHCRAKAGQIPEAASEAIDFDAVLLGLLYLHTSGKPKGCAFLACRPLQSCCCRAVPPCTVALAPARSPSPGSCSGGTPLSRYTPLAS